MEREQCIHLIEELFGLDDSEIKMAIEKIGFQALSDEGLALIARSQVSRARSIRDAQKILFPVSKYSVN